MSGVLAPDPGRVPALQTGWQAIVKRMMDIAGAIVGIVILLPVLAVTGILVRLDSPGPSLFRQDRVGLQGRTFLVYKFRSMHQDADPELHRAFLAGDGAASGAATGIFDGADNAVGGVHKVTNDPRITRLGRILRRASIDELPQLVNVLKGEMSMVGPRPDVTYSLENYEPHHYLRFAVKPGMTGLWQVEGRSALSYREMLELDVRYANNWSLAQDLRLLALTFPRLLRSNCAA